MEDLGALMFSLWVAAQFFAVIFMKMLTDEPQARRRAIGRPPPQSNPEPVRTSR